MQNSAAEQALDTSPRPRARAAQLDQPCGACGRQPVLRLSSPHSHGAFQSAMKIVTYNINGISARLPNLLALARARSPRMSCASRSSRRPRRSSPRRRSARRGYGVIWHGQKSWNGVAILARGVDPIETRRGLPGDPEDVHSRYIEAAVRGVTSAACTCPTATRRPGPKFDYKLALVRAASPLTRPTLPRTRAPVVLAGDYNVIPTELDVYKPERWVDDALFRPEVRAAFARLIAQGWTDAIRALHPGRAHLHLLGLFPQRLRARRGAAHRPPAAESALCGAP